MSDGHKINKKLKEEKMYLIKIQAIVILKIQKIFYTNRHYYILAI